MRMRSWVRRPQEREGKHLFSGTLYVTRGVNTILSPAEIIAIYLDMRRFVSEYGGADYFQVYENEVGEKLYFIDQGLPESKACGAGSKEENCCILMCSHEY